MTAPGRIVVVCGIFSCNMWKLDPWPGIEPGPPALEVQKLSHWTPRGVLWRLLMKGNGPSWNSPRASCPRPQGCGQATPSALRGLQSVPAFDLGHCKEKGWRTVAKTSGHGRPLNPCVFSVKPLFKFQKGVHWYVLILYVLSISPFRQNSKWFSILKHMKVKKKRGGSETVKDRTNWIRNLGEESYNKYSSILASFPGSRKQECAHDNEQVWWRKHSFPLGLNCEEFVG